MVDGDGRNDASDPPPADALMDDEPEWTEDDENRYQLRRHEERRRVRRRRRQAASFAAVVLLVFGIGVGAAGIYQGWWEWPLDDDPAADGGAAVDCPAPSVTAAPVEGVTVTVLNATDTRGLAMTVAAEFQARGFTVTEIGNDEVDVVEAAQVRYGPESTLQARTVAAQVPGVVLVDDARAGTDVELSIGAAFVGLNPPEVAAAATVPIPAESPSGCVTPAPAAPAADPAATPTG